MAGNSLQPSVRTTVQKRRVYRPVLEALEDRLPPAVYRWFGSADDRSWTEMENWRYADGGRPTVPPGNEDDVIFDNRNSDYSVVNQNFTVKSLRFEAAQTLLTLGPGSRA